MVPVRASYIGTDTSSITDDLSFSYLTVDGEEFTAINENERSDSLFTFPRLYPNGVAVGSVVIEAYRGVDQSGLFVFTVIETGQRVHFTF